MRTSLLLLALALSACAPSADEPPASPYAAETDRPIKALSAQEIADLRAGEGMGLAKAAELNHYPGPRHVLDLADDLDLTDTQRAQTQAIFEAMQTEARRLGAMIVAQETTLDSLFAGGTAEAGTLRARLNHIGALQSELRFVHLDAHLQMRRLLTPRQVMHYDMVRGYSNGADHDHHAM